MSTPGIQPDTTLPKVKKIKTYLLQVKESGGAIVFTEMFNTLGTVTKIAGVGDQITLQTANLFNADLTIVLVSPTGQQQTFMKSTQVNQIQITPSITLGAGDQFEISIQVITP